MVRAFEIVRTPDTRSTETTFPAVSTSSDRRGSASMKLLWYVKRRFS
jgi:hypothetical protein